MGCRLVNIRACFYFASDFSESIYLEYMYLQRHNMFHLRSRASGWPKHHFLQQRKLTRYKVTNLKDQCDK